MRNLLLVIVLLFGCGGGSSDVEVKTADDVKAQPKQVAFEQVDGPPLFVVVHKTTKLRTEPKEDAPYLQFVTEKEWASLEEELASERKDLAALEKKEADARKEAERKKREKARKSKKKKKKKKRKKKLSKKQREREKARAELKREKEKARKEQRERRLGETINDRRRKRLTKFSPDGTWIAHIPFRLIGESSGWVELETIGTNEDPTHCTHHAIARLGSMRARFYVKKSELSPVVNRQVRVSDPYGTEVALLPGVGLSERSPGEYTVFVDGHVLDLALHSDSVGTSYQPIRKFEAPVTDTVFKEIAIAENRLRLRSKMRLPFNPYIPMYVAKTLWVGRKFYATLETGCSQISLRVRESDIEPSGPRKAQRLSSEEVAIVAPFIKPDTPLSTERGVEVGEATTRIPLQSFDGQCGELRVWRGKRGQRTITVCADPNRVITQ